MSKIKRPDGLVVLSLFDGMSCGRLALERAGIKIANNLKKHGLWLVKKSPYGNLGEYLGKYNFNGGVIMCNWEKFIEYGYTQESLNEILKDNPDFGNQIIDYQEIIPKKIIN